MGKNLLKWTFSHDEEYAVSIELITEKILFIQAPWVGGLSS